MAASPALSTARSRAADPVRSRFALIIIAGHALKHALTSGLAAVWIPEIKLALGLTATQVGSLGTVQQVTGWAATMSAGYLGDRFTHRTGLMLGLSLGFTSLALLILGIAPGYAVIVGAMLLMGFGPSMFHPPAVGALSRRFADRRSFAISLHGMGGSIGEVLGPLIAGGLVAVLYWRDVLVIEFVPGVLAALAMWRLLDSGVHAGSGPAQSVRAYVTSFTSLLAQRAMLMIFLVTAFRAVGQAITSIFLPVYMREDLGYSATLVASYVAMGQLAGIGSQPLMGHLADRFGHKPVILPALLAFALLLGLLPLAEGKLQLGIVILAMGVFVFSMQSILTSAAVELSGEAVHSTVVSLIYASSFIGSLSPTLAGVLADAYGLRSTFVFSFALVLLAAIVMGFTPRRRAATET